jgi:hypothetical protein
METRLSSDFSGEGRPKTPATAVTQGVGGIARTMMTDICALHREDA